MASKTNEQILRGFFKDWEMLSDQRIVKTASFSQTENKRPLFYNHETPSNIKGSPVDDKWNSITISTSMFFPMNLIN